MLEPEWLSIGDIEVLCKRIQIGSPAHQIILVANKQGTLESALDAPRNMFTYGEDDLTVLAARYAYGIAKGHVLIDGNKRLAFHAMVAFLRINDLVLIEPYPEFYAGQIEALVRDDIDTVDLARELARCVELAPEDAV
ncbi:type II toxin-antitoxin system death-on-curing family toxin [Stappia sp.]|uniref:type II toxin-antitoxin system death-on-curing family toxin n=1 Tax=Stappia sp. TaxID=1870903 RepID=UPI0032D92F72